MESNDGNYFKIMPNLGQVWTPNDIARRMIDLSYSTFGRVPNLVLDPSCGPATFEKAMVERNVKAGVLICCDIDSRLCKYTSKYLIGKEIKSVVIQGDYLTSMELTNNCDIVIMNPPYIRHESINLKTKIEYHNLVHKWVGKEINRRANLMTLFLLKSINDLKENGILCAIVYDAIFETQYGKEVTRIINTFMDEIKVEHIKTPFEKTLIDANILVLRKRKIQNNIKAEILIKNQIPINWVKLSELLETRRGTGLKVRSAFILQKDNEFYKYSSEFIMKQAKLGGVIIRNADVRALIYENENDIDDEVIKFLQNRVRNLNKDPNKILHKPIRGPILFNYYVRNQPKHLLNPNLLISSDNFYVSSPRNGFPDLVAWMLLNSTLYSNCIKIGGRNQGNGLIKLQLYEYKDSIVPDWRLLSSSQVISILNSATRLVKENANWAEVNDMANFFVDQYCKYFRAGN